MELFCLKCKSNQKVSDVEVKKSKNNRSYQIAKCEKCNTKMSRFLKNEKGKYQDKLNELLKEDDKKL